MSARYPWQQTQWAEIKHRIRDGNLPHALLLSGSAGLGKQQFARELVRVLLCSQSDKTIQACGRCQQCRLLRAQSHPDFYPIDRAPGGRQILVDQIRALNAFMMMGCQYGRYKIGLIGEAEALNRNAANSLLKILEEPPARSLIILVSSTSMQMPATLRSRCQRVLFSPPSRANAAAWLSEQVPDCNAQLLVSLAHGHPLLAREFSQGDFLQVRDTAFSDLSALLMGRESAVTLAKRWQKVELSMLLDWMLSWAMDIVRLRFGADTNHLDNPDFYPRLDGFSKCIDIRCLYALLDEMLEFKRTLDIALNQRLRTEDLALAWSTRWQKI
jgi:DNA polymerase-3 subunit delta'